MSHMKQKYSGKLIFIPKDSITQDAMRHTQDVVELKSSFINQYISDAKHATLVAYLDIQSSKETDEIDIVRLGIEQLMLCKLQYCHS